MRNFVCAGIAVLLLSGCSEAGRALINTSIEKVEYRADTAAAGLVKAPCSMTAGAYFRLNNPNQKRGVELLCDTRALMQQQPTKPKAKSGGTNPANEDGDSLFCG